MCFYFFLEFPVLDLSAGALIIIKCVSMQHDIKILDSMQ